MARLSEAAAQNIASLKKQQMAEAAEKLLAGKGWFPAPLRTGEPSGEEERS